MNQMYHLNCNSLFQSNILIIDDSPYNLMILEEMIKEYKKIKLFDSATNGKLAIQKLKSIFAYTKDYRNILDEYKKQNPTSLVFNKRV